MRADVVLRVARDGLLVCEAVAPALHLPALVRVVHGHGHVGDDDLARARVTRERQVTPVRALDWVLKLDEALGALDEQLGDLAAPAEVRLDVLVDVVRERDRAAQDDRAPRVIVERLVEARVLGVHQVALVAGHAEEEVRIERGAQEQLQQREIGLVTAEQLVNVHVGASSLAEHGPVRLLDLLGRTLGDLDAHAVEAVGQVLHDVLSLAHLLQVDEVAPRPVALVTRVEAADALEEPPRLERTHARDRVAPGSAGPLQLHFKKLKVTLERAREHASARERHARRHDQRLLRQVERDAKHDQAREADVDWQCSVDLAQARETAGGVVDGLLEKVDDVAGWLVGQRTGLGQDRQALLNVGDVGRLHRQLEHVARVAHLEHLDLEDQVVERRALDLGRGLLEHLLLEEARGDETEAHAVLHTTRAARALHAGRLRRPCQPQALQLCVLVAVHLLDQAKVDDVAHVGHRDRRLGDVGRDDDLAHAPVGAAEDTLLLVAVEGRVQREHDQAALKVGVVDALVDQVVQLLDLGQTRQEHEDRAQAVVVALVVGRKLVPADADDQLNRGLKHLGLYLRVAQQLALHSVRRQRIQEAAAIELVEVVNLDLVQAALDVDLGHERRELVRRGQEALRAERREVLLEDLGVDRGRHEHDADVGLDAQELAHDQ
eukprot:Unigene2510_Nuclearia_a/m.7759 Unigene2510_Nuclearia_a/g.7759  ORF Unigene2510_Nuclearia_a/g.7759 Unigene2510_Nuclearia_a/m.7759 type:complete len:663 (+) Unigene2510_Nuclearia_a:721-2709(+)